MARGAALFAGGLCLAAAACAAPARPAGAGAAGASGSAGIGASVGTAGTTSPAGTAGATSTTGTAGSAGAGDPTGAAGTGSGVLPSGSGGTIDQGHLFTDAAVATSAPADAGGGPAPDAQAAETSKTTPGDGNTSTCHVGGMTYVLVFTQKGTDVTMVVTASNCAAGSHTIQIHGGFSCDNAGTEGGVWDGMRGAGIPALSCANNKGTLTYTRAGTDPTTSWTVGDHNTKTDVTLHPMSVDTSCGTFF
jgi:hypothetical protein